MKMMVRIVAFPGVSLLIASSNGFAQTIQIGDFNLSLVTATEVDASAKQSPGTFYLLSDYLQYGDGLPPYPFDPRPSLPAYLLASPDVFVVDDTADSADASAATTSGEELALDGGCEIASYTPQVFGSNDLWLEMPADSLSMPGEMTVILHNTTPGQMYLLSTKQELGETQWSVEQTVQGASGTNSTTGQLATSNRPVLFVRAQVAVPDFPPNVEGYTFDGPTFIPVDFKGYDRDLVTLDVLIGGQVFPYSVYTYLPDGAQTNWGVGIYFDRLANGTNTIQLISTIRLSDTLNDETPYLVVSNSVATINIQNSILFTNWSDLIFGNNCTIQAYSTIPNVDWEIDIYDVNNNFVNYQTGFSADGNISWTWDLRDYYGTSRTSDSDPFFYPYLTITPSSMGSESIQTDAGSTSRWTPPLAGQFPSQGSWLFAYLDNNDTDGSSKYPDWNAQYLPAIQTMEGGPELWSIAAWDYPLKFGTNYTQAERNQSWDSLQWGYWMANWSVNNGNSQDQLNTVIESARVGSSWPPGGSSQLYGALKIYGFNVMKFQDYNHKGDWP